MPEGRGSGGREITPLAPPRFRAPGRRYPKFVRGPDGSAVRAPTGGVATSTGVQQLLDDEALPGREPWMPEYDTPPPPEAPEPGATGGVLFTDLAYKDGKKMDPQPSTYDKLRDAFTNADLWDTLTPELANMMLNPPATYDPVYQRKVNVAVLTCIKTLANVQRMESNWDFERAQLLEKRVGALERGPKRW